MHLMTFFFALHLILSSNFDVVDTRTRPSNVTRRVPVIFLEAHPYWFGRDPNLCSKSEFEFVVRKPIWSRTEAFENRGLTVDINLLILLRLTPKSAFYDM